MDRSLALLALIVAFRNSVPFRPSYFVLRPFVPFPFLAFRLREVWLRLALHVSRPSAIFFHNSYFIIHNSLCVDHQRRSSTYLYNLPPDRLLTDAER